MSTKLALLILSFGAAATTQAMSVVRTPLNHAEHPPTAAPEIDPGSAMSAFTLLAGGLVLIRGRRSSK